eukprot:3571375-Prymnesium_polylepis.1
MTGSGFCDALSPHRETETTQTSRAVPTMPPRASGPSACRLGLAAARPRPDPPRARDGVFHRACTLRRACPRTSAKSSTATLDEIPSDACAV